MSILIFVSPLAASAMISLWLGFKMRMILFGAWLSACLALLVLLLKSAFEEVAFTQPGLFLLGMFIVFHITAFVLGLLFVRARNARSET
ncbi:MAG TPA: hypothetical protein DE314_06365 [Sulfitobacter sp.]|nr:hypothetical protein [Sulfitobacter sp.]